jgi:prepilin-type processing-associated H-X9-DG protein
MTKLIHANRGTAAMTKTELVVVVAILAILAGLYRTFYREKRGSVSRIVCVNQLRQIGLGCRVWATSNGDRLPFKWPETPRGLDRSNAWARFLVLSNELQTPAVFLCPDDATRTNSAAVDFKFGANQTRFSLGNLGNSAVSYFAGVEADESMPQALLAGDRNLAPDTRASLYSSTAAGGSVWMTNQSVWTLRPSAQLHGEAGNVLLVDGSVQQMRTPGLQRQLTAVAQRHGTNVNRFVFPQ